MTTPGQAKAQGIIFYDLPEELTECQVDSLIWPAVKRINESGWVWTAESCQGHPDADKYEPWANNTRPMLRLVCVKERTGEMLAKLLESCRAPGYDPVKDDGENTPTMFFTTSITLCPQERSRAKDFTEVLVYLSASTVFERGCCLRAYERFAEMVNQ